MGVKNVLGSNQMSEQAHFLEGSGRHSKNVLQSNYLREINFLNGGFVMKFHFLITGAEGIVRDEDGRRGNVCKEFRKQRVLFSLEFSL